MAGTGWESALGPPEGRGGGRKALSENVNLDPVQK